MAKIMVIKNLIFENQMTKVQKLFKENPDLDIGEGYMTFDQRLRKEDPEAYELLFKGKYLYKPTKDLPLEEEDLASEHHEKSYQYIHEFLDLLEKEKCILKRPQVGKPSSYTWKHKVEYYVRKKRGDNTWKHKTEYYVRDHFVDHHWIGNGLFIAVLRERNLPEKRADILNAWVPFGCKALNFCEKNHIWG